MSSVEVALSVIRRLYVDSAPLIYFVEENPVYFGKMREVVRIAETTDMSAHSSALALAEVLVVPLRQENQRHYKAYHDILLDGDIFTLFPLTADICVAAAELRARYRLRTPDALHVASAISTGCDAILTNDRDMRRIQELTILVLDELEA